MLRLEVFIRHYKVCIIQIHAFSLSNGTKKEEIFFRLRIFVNQMFPFSRTVNPQLQLL